MPINRAPFNALVDDTGTGLTGSIWNKAAIKSVLLDPIDAAGISDVIAWTPTDSSGAGLTLTVTFAVYAKIGRVVHLWFNVAYPATANAARARISGIPFLPSYLGACYLAFGTPKLLQIATDGGIYFFNATNMANLNNVDLSGATIVGVGSYLAP